MTLFVRKASTHRLAIRTAPVSPDLHGRRRRGEVHDMCQTGMPHARFVRIARNRRLASRTRGHGTAAES